MNGFPYWQFHNDRWLSGKVSSLDLDAQGLFLHFCMKAWTAQGVFNICSTSIKMRFRKPAEWIADTVSAMADVGILVLDGDGYRIKFIDEQLEALHSVRQSKSKAGKASAAKRALLNTLQDEESIVEKTREEKSSVLKSVQHKVNTCSTPVETKPPKPKPELAQPCFESPAFLQAWQDWQEHRREIKKPLTPRASQEQMKEFRAWGEVRAIKAIRHTIKNQWIGIREADAQPNANKPQVYT